MPRKGPRFQSQPGGNPCKRFGSSVHKFILNQPAPPDDGFVKRFIMSCPAPAPAWGEAMERALSEGFIAAGFRISRCRCHTPHHIAEIRMTCDAGEPPPIREMRRLLRRVVQGVGSEITPGGLNCLVRRNRVE